jgi:hypothetical protein
MKTQSLLQMDEEITIPDRDRDKSYIGKFSEVINQVRITTCDQSTVIIDLENIGQIEVRPWSVEHEVSQGVSVGQDMEYARFNPCMAHDVMILEFMYEHAKRFKEMVDKQTEELTKK